MNIQQLAICGLTGVGHAAAWVPTVSIYNTMIRWALKGWGGAEGPQPRTGELAGLCHTAPAADGLFCAASAAGHAILGALVQHFGLRGWAASPCSTYSRHSLPCMQPLLLFQKRQTLSVAAASSDGCWLG